ASPAALLRVAEILKATKGERIVVVSATAGTTDALVAAARASEAGDAQAALQALEGLADAHKNLAADALGFSSAEVLTEIADLTERTHSLLESVAILRECSERTLDAIMSYGERISAPIVAAVLTNNGTKAEALSAEGLLITDDVFGHASPILDATRERVSRELVPRMRYGVVPVVTGFIGSNAAGVTTTLGRGGSDYSAAVLAAATAARRERGEGHDLARRSRPDHRAGRGHERRSGVRGAGVRHHGRRAGLGDDDHPVLERELDLPGGSRRRHGPAQGRARADVQRR